MAEIKIRVFHTGTVCVAPALPFGGDHCNVLQASGFLTPKSDRLWLPVSSYLIEHPRGLVLVDAGWSRSMSPHGIEDRRAQIRSLGSWLLYKVNQGVVPLGACIDEQLAELGVRPSDLAAVLITHLDCDHANGLAALRGAPRILVSHDELRFARRHRVRYSPKWWRDVELETFDWTGALGPVGRSFDLFGDGSIELINIPGHSDGLFAVQITNDSGRFVLLVSDGGYAARSWREMIMPGIASNRELQRLSLAWIKERAEEPLNVATLANHDPEIEPMEIDL